MSASLHIIILAAGEGKRRKSSLPKVLQPVAGVPMLGHVIAAARALAPAAIHVVYGHGGEQVRRAFADQADLHWSEQRERLGTGHAVAQAMPQVPDDARVLVLYGDVPLIRSQTLGQLLAAMQRISRWQIAEASELDADTSYTARLQYRLDTSQLPRPLQWGAVGGANWTLQLEASSPVPAASAAEADGGPKEGS